MNQLIPISEICRQLEQAVDTGERGALSDQEWRFVDAVRSGQCTSAETLGLELFHQSIDPQEKCFYLYVLVALTEIKFNSARRLEKMKLWSEIPDWAEYGYCMYIRSYQESLSLFFDARLFEAQNYFSVTLDISRRLRYRRGEMICLFHLGLIARDQRNKKKAHQFFAQASFLAESLRLPAFEKRCQKQLQDEPDVLHDLLLAKNFTAARKFYLQKERARRRSKGGRDKNSLYRFLPLIARGFGKLKFEQKLMMHIKDGILKNEVLRLKRSVFGLSTKETLELEWSESAHGQGLTVCGLRVEDLRRQDIRALAELLAHSRGEVSKEQICRDVWSLDYDPVIHDRKIYKLIHEFRSTFGATDLVLNVYGGYRLNPEAKLSQ